MTKLIGISGSLRSGSYNTMLIKAAARVMPVDVEFRIETIRDIPLYDGDIETKSGIPPAVTALKNTIAAADGVLIASPEYNNSVPGVLKNAIDWLSRPPEDSKRVFGGKPFGIIGATPGGFGTILSQNAWLPVLLTLGTQPWFGARLLVSRAPTVFGEDGTLTDKKIEAQLRSYVEGFARYVRSYQSS